MKAIASVAIAAIIAATSLTTTTNAAFAGGNNWNKYQHQQYKHHGKPYKGKPYKGKHYYKGHNHSSGWNPGAALATGAILGLAFGALSAPTYYTPPPVYAYPPPPPPPAYPTYYSSYQGHPNAQHVSWCYSKYRSYNARYNTWIGHDGFTHQCVSPF